MIMNPYSSIVNHLKNKTFIGLAATAPMATGKTTHERSPSTAAPGVSARNTWRRQEEIKATMGPFLWDYSMFETIGKQINRSS